MTEAFKKWFNTQKKNRMSDWEDVERAYSQSRIDTLKEIQGLLPDKDENWFIKDHIDSELKSLEGSE